jgi:hypothetical protein
MKIVWSIVALLLIAGLIVVFQPPSPSKKFDPTAAIVEAAEATISAAEDAKPTSATTATTTDAPIPSVAASATAAIQAAAEVTVLVPAPTTTTHTEPSPEPSPEPTPEPPAAKPEDRAAGNEFTPEIPTIPQAEILPSRFIRLPDGAISVDDAWTVRGEGTKAAPYEVSWEYISSAQETYTPRLGEKKIAARIAFLSGKYVRISGYLAFPLVAPTASECLVMLNQWDGCCIGVPPTPYDAVEVKLAAELKGWKKHTINFGAVEGVFKVEPYLVENWLVGLYLIEGAQINTEL